MPGAFDDLKLRVGDCLGHFARGVRRDVHACGRILDGAAGHEQAREHRGGVPVGQSHAGTGRGEQEQAAAGAVQPPDEPEDRAAGCQQHQPVRARLHRLVEHHRVQRHGQAGQHAHRGAGVTSDSIGKVKAGELVNFVAQQVGGKGGGKPDLAMAGGSDAAALPAALASVAAWVAQRR